MHEANPQVGRQLAEVARIFVHALIGIDADMAGIGEPEGAARHEPVLDEIVREALAQLELQGFAEPPLRHVEHQQRACDDAEYAQLHQEPAKVPVRQRVIEGLIPAVEADLSIGGGDDDDKQRD